MAAHLQPCGLEISFFALLPDLQRCFKPPEIEIRPSKPGFRCRWSCGRNEAFPTSRASFAPPRLQWLVHPRVDHVDAFKSRASSPGNCFGARFERVLLLWFLRVPSLPLDKMRICKAFSAECCRMRREAMSKSCAELPLSVTLSTSARRSSSDLTWPSLACTALHDTPVEGSCRMLGLLMPAAERLRPPRQHGRPPKAG